MAQLKQTRATVVAMAKDRTAIQPSWLLSNPCAPDGVRARLDALAREWIDVNAEKC